MAQRSALEEAVKRKLIDEDAQKQIAAIPDFLQRAQRDLEDLCLFREQHAETVFSTITNLTLTTAQTPSDFIRVRPLAPNEEGPFWVDGMGSPTAMRLLESRAEGLRDYGYDTVPATNPGAPKALTLGTDDSLGFMEVFPAADANAPTGTYRALTTYELHLPYWKRLAELSASTSENVFTTDLLARQDLEEQATALALFEMRYTDAAAAYFSYSTSIGEDLRFDQKMKRVDKHASIHMGKGYAWSRRTRGRRR